VTRIERLEGPGAAAAVEPLLREYVPWVVAELAAALGLTFDDVDAVIEQHHAAFRAELPNLVEGRGRLLVARVDGEPVGVGALRPVDATTAEVKRMFVRPRAQGHGIGRALLERLLDDARGEGYAVARLETLTVMTAARALYRSLGFRDTPAFPGSEAALSGLDPFTVYMALDLAPESASAESRHRHRQSRAAMAVRV
jgi:GNAT superfamily N-acetyltransferase